MRKFLIVSLCLVTMILGCAGQTAQNEAKPQIYTAYNIWLHKGKIYCINFKLGSKFIPAGTPVKKIHVSKNQDWQDIRFRLADTNEQIIINFNEPWHPGESPKSYARKMFTHQNFSELTQGFDPKEIRSIQSGVVTVGMSKPAVLVSYGPPPEHYTKDLSSDQWYYWINRMRKKKICFDDNQKAKRCGYFSSDKL